MKRQTGFSLLEVLVTVLILAFGLLGLAGLQARTMTTEMESYQRSVALVALNGFLAGATDTTAATGGAVTLPDSQLINGKYCITQIQAADTATCKPRILEVAVAWQGIVKTVAPSVTCGTGSYSDDTLRRVVSSRIGFFTNQCSS